LWPRIFRLILAHKSPIVSMPPGHRVPVLWGALRGGGCFPGGTRIQKVDRVQVQPGPAGPGKNDQKRRPGKKTPGKKTKGRPWTNNKGESTGAGTPRNGNSLPLRQDHPRPVDRITRTRAGDGHRPGSPTTGSGPDMYVDANAAGGARRHPSVYTRTNGARKRFRP